MVEPYQAVGLIQSMRGIRRREEIEWNLEHISHMIKAASWLSSMDLPVRLICIPEGGLQGFTDEVFDLDHEQYALECAIDIPGPETDYLGALARQWKAHVVAQAKARHPEFPGRFFNVGFVIEPEDGTVILTHHKLVPLLPVEHSVTPHNVWDRWIELYGATLDAFYPVADTEIGRIGIMMANEASYPENARGLAMNGCEIAYRGPYPAPGVMSGMFSVQNRARALDNNMYVIGMNLGTYYLDREAETPIDTFSGGSQIVDYRGHVVTEVPYGAGSTWIAGTLDIEALRHFRQTAQWDNWMKDLTTEQYQLIYEQPIYPKNLYLDRPPYQHADYRREVTEKQIDLLQDRGIWAPAQRPRSRARRGLGGRRVGGDVGLGEDHPLALLGTPFLVRAAQLPVAAGRQRLRRQAALDEQVAADEAHGGRLAVDEGVPPALRESQRPDRLQLQRGILARAAAAVQPHDLQLTGALQRLLVIGTVDLEDDERRHPGGDAGQGDGHRRNDRLVADEEVPGGVRGGGVGPARAHDLQGVAGLCGGGPGAGQSPVAVDDEVERQPSALGVPVAHRVGPRPLAEAALDVVICELAGPESGEVIAAEDDPDHAGGQPGGLSDGGGKDAAFGHQAPGAGKPATIPASLGCPNGGAAAASPITAWSGCASGRPRGRRSRRCSGGPRRPWRHA